MEVVDLEGRKGLVVGIANEESLAWSAAQHFRSADAELGVTFLNDKARAYVEPLARKVEAPLFLPCNITSPGQLEAVFAAIEAKWGQLDFVFHSIAWARRETSMDASPTVRRKGSLKPCSFRVTPSSAWRNFPSHS